MSRELRHRRDQALHIVERAVERQIDLPKAKAATEIWLANLLFQDFLERKGLADRKGAVA